MAKKITKYQAEDGTEFATEGEADHHDRKIVAQGHFQGQFVDTHQSEWDFTMAYNSDDSGVLVIAVNDLPDFLVNNAALIQIGYGLANLTPLDLAKLAVAPIHKPRVRRVNKR